MLDISRSRGKAWPYDDSLKHSRPQGARRGQALHLQSDDQTVTTQCDKALFFVVKSTTDRKNRFSSGRVYRQNSYQQDAEEEEGAETAEVTESALSVPTDFVPLCVNVSQRPGNTVSLLHERL